MLIIRHPYIDSMSLYIKLRKIGNLSWHRPFRKGNFLMDFVVVRVWQIHIDWFIHMLLVSRGGHVEEDAVDVFHHYMFTCLLLLWCRIPILFGENNILEVLKFPFNNIKPLANLWFIRFQGQFPILRTRRCPDLYPVIHPPRRTMAFCKGRMLIRGFIRSPLCFHPLRQTYQGKIVCLQMFIRAIGIFWDGTDSFVMPLKDGWRKWKE